MWHLLMTSDFSVSAKTMRMVLKVSDRVLIAHCVSLSPYIGGKPFLFFLILFCFLTLQYCISFAIYQHEFATGIHVFPILDPPPSSLPVLSLSHFYTLEVCFFFFFN